MLCALKKRIQQAGTDGGGGLANWSLGFDNRRERNFRYRWRREPAPLCKLSDSLNNPQRAQSAYSPPKFAYRQRVDRIGYLEPVRNWIIDRNAIQNRLIALLPRKDRLHFIASCVPVQLLLGQVLCEPGNATRFAYFPVDSFISLLTQIDGKPALEVGMVGREGMLGAELGLGVATTPLHAVVQG